MRKLLARFVAAVTGGKQTAPTVQPADPETKIRAANKELRATAKWILTSFAAVGAIVVGGLQLSSVGKLTGETPDERVWAALLGITAAALGVVIALWFTSLVLQPYLNSFRSADKHADLADRALAEPFGMTYAELKAKIKEKRDAVKKAEDEHSADSDEYRSAVASRAKWDNAKRDALFLIGTELLWQRYSDAFRAVLVAVVLVLGGVVAFAWGANPPEDEKEKPPVVLGEAPLLLDVHLTSGGAAALKKARGCATSDLQVLSVGGTVAEREVVTVPGPQCKPVRFVLTPSLGTATAAARP